MTTDMATKANFISEIASILVRQGQHMAVPDLAQLMNSNYILTSNGKPYSGERGTYTFLDAVYRRLESQGRQADAHNVAEAFTRRDGSHAWDK